MNDKLKLYLNPGNRFNICRSIGMAGTVFAAVLIASPLAWANGTCNNPDTVGGGTLAPSPSSGAGWDVGSGQCNGDFTVVTDPSFPGGEIELGMRIEERRIGPVNPPDHTGIDYEVHTGHDTNTPATNRAWWNFQQSIAYNGVIDDLDELTFVIRTDAGGSVPSAPSFNMLGLRSAIDDRHSPKATTDYSDIYQTSQNPVFGWFSSYDMNAEGAWMLTLAAVEEGKLASVSICAHTAGAACAPAPAVYTCSGFEPPMDKTISVKKKNRVLPLKMVCTDATGNMLSDADIAAPIVQVTKSVPAGDATDPADVLLSAGQGTDGNEFVFSGSGWNFNLQTKNFTGSGTYTITAVAGGGDVLVGAPKATFVIE